MDDTKESFLHHYSQRFQAKENAPLHYPFKDHPQFPMLVDILSRKYRHHALLSVDFPTNIQPFFLEAFTQHLAHESVPPVLRQTELIFLAIENATIPLTKQKSVEDEFELLRSSLSKDNTYKLFVIPATWLFFNEIKPTDDRCLRKQMKLLLAHPRCRFIALTEAHTMHTTTDDRFTHVRISGPTDHDMMNILLQHRTELEEFHHVVIPEELLNQAYQLAERFLSTTNTLEHALMLLDSSAARIAMGEQPPSAQNMKPVLTSSVLLNVLSSWTQIPAASFQLHKFKLNEFTHNMQQRVFGQDIAINIIGQELLQAQANLKRRSGPFCSFLFAGPTHCGKKTLAVAMVEQLFKQPNILFFAQPTLTQTSLAEMKVQSAIEKRYLPLTEAIAQTPYAVFVFDHIEQASPAILDGLQEIVSTGYLQNADGQPYNFRQAIIILNTSKGTEQLNLSSPAATEIEEDVYTMDLMQLIMADQKHDKYSPTQHPSGQEIRNKLLPAIAELIPQSLYQHLQFVPFLPLNKESAEKIVRLKVKMLGKQLDSRYGIDIGYAPEVTRFLASEMVHSQAPEHTVTNPDHVLKQLYFCVEQALLNQTDNKRQSNQLFLQLNEAGNVLRSEWLAPTARQPGISA